MYILNNNGDITAPCLTQLATINGSDSNLIIRGQTFLFNNNSNNISKDPLSNVFEPFSNNKQTELSPLSK